MNEVEKLHFDNLLDSLHDKMSSAGCNDYKIKIKNEQDREFVNKILCHMGMDQDDEDCYLSILGQTPIGDNFILYDWAVLNYLRSKIT